MSDIILEQAIPFMREIETKLIPLGAHCALGGSVLHSGQSHKDLDIFVYPHNTNTPKTPEELLSILKVLFPTGYDATDDNYPHDRLRFVYMRELFGGAFWKVEFFIFLTQPPRQ